MLLDDIKALGMPEYAPMKGNSMTTTPKAADLFKKNGGDINRAVIDVQKATGYPISEAWWKQNIGTANNDLATAQKFDTKYAAYLQSLK